MTHSFLTLLSTSYTLARQPDRRQITDRRKEARGGRRLTDAADAAASLLAVLATSQDQPTHGRYVN